MKRVKNKIEIQNWWWKQFIPSIQASTEALWQMENDKLIQQKLAKLSSDYSLLNTSSFEKQKPFIESNSQGTATFLQVGDKDFKPLALPETMRLTEEYLKNKALPLIDSRLTETVEKNVEKGYSNNSDKSIINQLYENLFMNSKTNTNLLTKEVIGDSFYLTVPNTGLPFYAGWDETLRKFVVTNRMLSRKEAGFSINPLNPLQGFGEKDQENIVNSTANGNIIFNSAPLQGMNAATTLYWQIPFTTYDPDQFFALGMDGFSPIGWRKFLFRHSILKTWLNSIDKNHTVNTYKNIKDNKTFKKDSKILVVKSKKALMDTFEQPLPFGLLSNRENNASTNSLSLITLFKFKNLTSSANDLPYKENNSLNRKSVSRRLKKRYRRVKKHPRTPVWFPSGPLLNQVLPVHYIYIFYKRSRLPRDRYLKRRLVNQKTISKDSIIESGIISNLGSFNYDFTLRKRLKPKRKYHLKRDFYTSNIVIPRRLKFMDYNDAYSLFSQHSRQTSAFIHKRWRPLSSFKLTKSAVDLVNEQKLIRRKQRILASRKDREARNKDLSSSNNLTSEEFKQQQNLRVKQLRRRIQRQVLRSVWRYRPRAGGFVWPGDYLKLEQVKAPKLENNKSFITEPQLTMRSKKQKRKKKRNLVEWQVQPKKYFYQKHNLKVMKRKLEKAQRFDKIHLKLQELNYKF
jgi:hypothetical protein